MTIDERVMVDALEQLARYADAPPPELSATIRRRATTRAKREAWTALAVALAVVATVAGVVTAAGRGGSVQGAAPGRTPVGSTLPWHVPSLADTSLPDASTEWPEATVLMSDAPDGRRPALDVNLDATHVLVETGPGPGRVDAYWSYDTPTGEFEHIVDFPVPGGVAGGLAVSAHWLVFSVRAGDDQQVYKMRLGREGPAGAQYVTTIHVPNGTGPWFATDSTLYFSGQTPGVLSLPLAGGVPTPVPGFEDMLLLYDTPWAARVTDPGITRAMRNLLTGADIEVSVPPQTLALACVPAFCLGTRDDGSTYIQLPGGGNRRALDGGDERSIVAAGSGGLIITDGSTPQVVDPVSGKAGIIRPAAGSGTSRGGDAIGWATTRPAVIDTYLVFVRIQ